MQLLARLDGITGTELQERLLPWGILVRNCSNFTGLGDGHIRLPVTADVRLRELSSGGWEGRLVQNVIDENPAAWNAWFTDPVRMAPPGGETAAGLWQQFWGGALADLGRDRSAPSARAAAGAQRRLAAAGPGESGSSGSS